MARTFVRASSQYLEALTAPIAAPLDVTMMAWYKPSSIANGTVFGLGDSNSSEYLALGMDGSGHAFIENTGANSATTASLTNGAWNHLCAVQTGITSRLVYLNGVASVADVTSRSIVAVDTTTIGGLVINAARTSFAGGDIGEVAIWSSALNSTDVGTLAGGALPSTVQSGSLVGYWKITGTDSPELDSTANARSLTVTGATAAAGGNPPVSGGTPFLILPPAPVRGASYAAHRAASI